MALAKSCLAASRHRSAEVMRSVSGRAAAFSFRSESIWPVSWSASSCSPAERAERLICSSFLILPVRSVVSAVVGVRAGGEDELCGEGDKGAGEEEVGEGDGEQVLRHGGLPFGLCRALPLSLCCWAAGRPGPGVRDELPGRGSAHVRQRVRSCQFLAPHALHTYSGRVAGFWAFGSRDRGLAAAEAVWLDCEKKIAWRISCAAAFASGVILEPRPFLLTVCHAIRAHGKRVGAR